MAVNNHDGDSQVPASPQWKTFFEMIAAHKPARWILVAAVILGLGETVLSLLIPLLTMEMVDQLSAASLAGGTIALLVSIFVVQALLSGLSIYTMSYVGQYVVAGLRRAVWQKVLGLPIPFFDRNPSGETMSRVTHDTNVIKDFITGHVIPFVSGLISIIGAVVLLLAIDWKMTLLMLLAAPAALLILWPLGAKMFSISRSMQEETAQFQGDLGRVLADIRLVKVSLAEPVEEKQGGKRIAQLFRYGLKEARIQSIVSPLMMTVMLLILVLLIGYGGVRVAEETLTAGALVAIILYMFQIIVPFTQLAAFFSQFQKAMGASERIREIMQEKPEEPAASEAVELVEESSYRQSLVFDQVSFGYSPERQILQGVSFKAGSGHTTAFVGPSGTGKTTIFSLIEQFYLPGKGNIYYGSVPISDIPLKEWRQRIAYVSQESPVMAGTIRENLIYGLNEVNEERIQEAVKQASLTSFIDSLPENYNTEVGERGVKLSGGQRQRLSIARAILRDPDILLLDEATAHLDSASEHLVQEALQQLMKGRTTLIIAHRLSTVRHADNIIVIENGEVTGQGSHDRLMNHHDFYRTLVQHQFDDVV